MEDQLKQQVLLWKLHPFLSSKVYDVFKSSSLICSNVSCVSLAFFYLEYYPNGGMSSALSIYFKVRQISTQQNFQGLPPRLPALLFCKHVVLTLIQSLNVLGLVKGEKFCFRNLDFYFWHGESTSTASQLNPPASQKSNDLNKVLLLL